MISCHHHHHHPRRTFRPSGTGLPSSGLSPRFQGSFLSCKVVPFCNLFFPLPPFFLFLHQVAVVFILCFSPHPSCSPGRLVLGLKTLSNTWIKVYRDQDGALCPVPPRVSVRLSDAFRNYC